MGGPRYNFDDRSFRTASFKGMTQDQLFEQNTKRSAHDSMIPSRKENKAHLRESRDSEAHPLSIPIILGLDITGSMGDIPENLIKTGLPKMVGRLKELGVESPHILIMAVGDSKYDQNNGVFQLGQFEGGDKEMDMWLSRIWISKGGGGNLGESYLWTHWYALNHTETDSWDKRKQKGFIFTIGDDHCHDTLLRQEMDEVMGYLSKSETVNADKVIAGVKERWNVYHIELGECQESWGKLIGRENVISDIARHDYDGMAEKIAQVVAKNCNCIEANPFSQATNAESFNDQKITF